MSDYQCIILTMKHKLLTISHIQRCDERLAFQGGVARPVIIEINTNVLSGRGG